MKVWELIKRILKLSIVLPMVVVLFVMIFVTVILFLVTSLVAYGQVKTGQIAYLMEIGSERFGEEIKSICSEDGEKR